MPSDCLQVMQCDPAQVWIQRPYSGASGFPPFPRVPTHFPRCVRCVELQSLGVSLSANFSDSHLSLLQSVPHMSPWVQSTSLVMGLCCFNVFSTSPRPQGWNLNLSLGQKRKNKNKTKNMPFAVAFAYRTHPTR